MAEQTEPPGNRRPVEGFSPGGKIRTLVWHDTANEQRALAIQAAILASGVLSGAPGAHKMLLPGQGNRHSGAHQYLHFRVSNGYSETMQYRG